MIETKILSLNIANTLKIALSTNDWKILNFNAYINKWKSENRSVGYFFPLYFILDI